MPVNGCETKAVNTAITPPSEKAEGFEREIKSLSRRPFEESFSLLVLTAMSLTL
ncbi:MFS transporter [Aspergillus luchuensis]|uniref:MFS transporter n=1 Tax=Aspergillus kawachii TaxID=1069201 RepID=A0A146FRA9_ASPKA|nr:MFS transporter [Aspergillus luchuensis]